MILDSILHAKSYCGLHPGVDFALNAIQNVTENDFSKGKLELDGENIYLMLKEYVTKSPGKAMFEAHRRYIDVMYMVEGEETIFVKPIDCLGSITKPYDASTDVLLAEMDEESTPIRLKTGMFVVLFPQDAHAPSCWAKGETNVRKIIAKVRME